MERAKRLWVGGNGDRKGKGEKKKKKKKKKKKETKNIFKPINNTFIILNQTSKEKHNIAH